MKATNNLGICLFFIALLGVPLNAWAKEWGMHQGNLRGWVAKIQTKEEEIKKLIEEKEHTKDKDKLKEIMDKMVEMHKALAKDLKDYEEERSHVRFQHPDKGDDLESKYRPVRLRTIEEIEGDMGLDGKLNRLKSKIERVYQKEANPSVAAVCKTCGHPKSAPGHHAPSPSPGPQRPKLSL